jgi:hypothetical protein
VFASVLAAAEPSGTTEAEAGLWRQARTQRVIRELDTSTVTGSCTCAISGTFRNIGK